MIELITADKKALNPRGGVSLKAGTEQLEIHYAGLSLLAPEKVTYRYKLDGFDQGWVDAGARAVAYYTRLPPGSYKFQVAARVNAGAWSEIPSAVTFSVRPHYYQTTIFSLACALVVLAGTTVAYKMANPASPRKRDSFRSPGRGAYTRAGGKPNPIRVSIFRYSAAAFPLRL